MTQRITTPLTTLLAITMMVGGLWAWHSAFRISEGTARPDVTLWAVRSAAVALGAGAQAIVLTFLVCVIYRRDLVSDLLRGGAALVAAIAFISAIALGLAGR